MCIFDETAIVESLIDKTAWFENSRMLIAILASSYSDDVIAIEVKKNRKILIRYLEFPSVKFLKIWQRSYSLLAFLAFNLSEKFVRQGFRSAQKTQKC